MAGSLKLNHCCIKWKRGMVSTAKEGPYRLARRRMGLDQRRQLYPRNHKVHLVNELTPARAFGG
jgi:hypothetical protein